MGHLVGGIDWGRTPPERRGRWGRWLYLQRWNAGRQTQESVRDTLEKMGHPIGGSYYSEMESGAKPVNEEWAAIFTRLWGSEPEPEEEQAAPADMATLLAKMDRQTDAIESVAKALLELIVRMDRDQRGARAQREQLAELLGGVAASLPEGTPGVSESRRRRRAQE